MSDTFEQLLLIASGQATRPTIPFPGRLGEGPHGRFVKYIFVLCRFRPVPSARSAVFHPSQLPTSEHAKQCFELDVFDMVSDST